MTIIFTPVEKPTTERERTARLNPFLDAVKSLVPDSGDALSFTVSGTSEREPSFSGKTIRYANKELRSNLVQLDAAAVAAGVTARRKIQDDGTTTTVTFWTIPRIIRATGK